MTQSNSYTYFDHAGGRNNGFVLSGTTGTTVVAVAPSSKQPKLHEVEREVILLESGHVGEIWRRGLNVGTSLKCKGDQMDLYKYDSKNGLITEFQVDSFFSSLQFIVVIDGVYSLHTKKGSKVECVMKATEWDFEGVETSTWCTINDDKSCNLQVREDYDKDEGIWWGYGDGDDDGDDDDGDDDDDDKDLWNANDSIFEDGQTLILPSGTTLFLLPPQPTHHKSHNSQHEALPPVVIADATLKPSYKHELSLFAIILLIYAIMVSCVTCCLSLWCGLIKLVSNIVRFIFDMVCSGAGMVLYVICCCWCLVWFFPERRTKELRSRRRLSTLTSIPEVNSRSETPTHLYTPIATAPPIASEIVMAEPIFTNTK